MIDKEKKLIEMFCNLIPKMSEEQKMYFLGYGDCMVDTLEHTKNLKRVGDINEFRPSGAVL